MHGVRLWIYSQILPLFITRKYKVTGSYKKNLAVHQKSCGTFNSITGSRDMEKMLHEVYLNVVIGHRDNAK